MDHNEIKNAIEAQGKAFEAFKQANDERLADILKKGVADPVTLEKLGKIEATLAGLEAINQKITLLDAQSKATREAEAQFKAALDKIETKLGRPRLGDPADRRAELKARVNVWARGVVGAHLHGVPNLPEDQRKALLDAEAEWKSLGITSDPGGGYLSPVEYVREIIRGETEISPARALVRVRTTALKSVQLPKRTGQFSAQWVADQGTKSETTGLAYGSEEIPTHELYALIDISNGNLEDSAFDLEAEITQETTEQFALAEGTAVVSGSGVGRPEGFLTHASLATTNSGAATAVTADGLLTLKHAIKSAYARNATWVMNRTTLGSIRKLKDGSGQYLWMPGLAMGKPNTIDGDPYVELPDMPSEAAAAKAVAYGDFRRAYTLVDRLQMVMLRDPYTQATSGNIRFIFRRRIGGQVVLAEAIRALVCAA